MNRSAMLLALICAGTIGISTVAIADEPTPPPPGADARHNPVFAACKKQADDQKLARGDARRAFMRKCIEAAQPATSN
jgi:hypothetical protein